jgi:hypothetical protein
MDCHSLISDPLDQSQKEEILGKFLTSKNKNGLTQLKNELSGLRNEKDDAIMTV